MFIETWSKTLESEFSGWYSPTSKATTYPFSYWTPISTNSTNLCTTQTFVPIFEVLWWTRNARIIGPKEEAKAASGWTISNCISAACPLHYLIIRFRILMILLRWIIADRAFQIRIETRAAKLVPRFFRSITNGPGRVTNPIRLSLKPFIRFNLIKKKTNEQRRKRNPAA